MPIKKCADAPQKVMLWLMDDVLRGAGIRDKANFAFWAPGGGMFGVKKYSDKLEKIRQERGVNGQFKRLLVSVDSDKKVATFKNVTNGIFRPSVEVKQERPSLLIILVIFITQNG
jgi:NADPH-dependent 2,4-dienoyl-CoA reductase/sulfur reductase-like enzyme